MGAVHRMIAMLVLVAALFVLLGVDVAIAGLSEEECRTLSKDIKTLTEYQLATLVNCGGEVSKKAMDELKRRLEREVSKRPDQFKTRQIVPFTSR